MFKIIGANQSEYGPISADQIRQWIAEGRVNGQTLAQAEGETGWKPISQYPEFASSFAATPPPPGFAPGAPQTVDIGQASNQIAGPAIALIVVGGLILAVALFAMVVTVLTGNNPPPSTGNPQIDRLLMGSNKTLSLVQQVFVMVIGGLILFGAIKMKRLESYGLSMTASILAMLPCSCCCLIGLPIGIWSLVVLNKPEVKAAFKR